MLFQHRIGTKREEDRGDSLGLKAMGWLKKGASLIPGGNDL